MSNRTHLPLAGLGYSSCQCSMRLLGGRRGTAPRATGNGTGDSEGDGASSAALFTGVGLVIFRMPLTGRFAEDAENPDAEEAAVVRDADRAARVSCAP